MTETEKEQSTTEETEAAELREMRWSVISFEKNEAGNLTYAQAERKLAELETQKVSGLCIVTNDAAARISK